MYKRQTTPFSHVIQDLENSIHSSLSIMLLDDKERSKGMEFRDGVLDISSFFLVESSGDSEEDFDSIVSMSCEDFTMEDGNDAESCCSGSFDIACMNDVSVIDVDVECDHGEDDEEEEEDGECDSLDSHEKWNWKHMKKSKVGEDGSEGMSEEEENKLFWDTCLAY